MKFRATASAWSNITYHKDEEIDLDIQPEDWEEMDEQEQREYLWEAWLDWLFDDIDGGLEPLEDDDEI